LEVFGEAELRLREAASKKILVEVTLLKAIEARNAISLDSVLQQLKNLREDNQPAQINVPARSPSILAVPGSDSVRAQMVAVDPPTPPTLAAAPIALPTEHIAEPPGAPPCPTEPKPELADLWAKLLDAVGRVSQFTRTYLLEAHPVSFANNLFTIGFDPEFEDHVGLVDNPRNHTLLQTKLQELGYPNTQLKFITAEAPGPRPAAPEINASSIPAAAKPGPARSAFNPAQKDRLPQAAFDKEAFKNDPLIQKALEVFKGQVVEVRA
jgi:DNA polymerase-3 subunit gamma/tau